MPRGSDCKPILNSVLSPVLGQMSLETTSAMQRYIFEQADNEYIRGSAKNPSFDRPIWLDQKPLAERIFAFNKILTHFKAIEGNDTNLTTLSPARSINKRAANFNLTAKPAGGDRGSDRDSPGNTSDNFTGLSKVSSIQSPVGRQRRFNNLKLQS